MADSSARVSVVLPVFNGAQYLREAIDSVLAQSLQDFELIIVDDASTDDSLAIARSYEAEHVRIVELQSNLGLAAALNAGMATASAPLIARQDQDDISHPRRLQRQVDLLDANPHVILVGAWARIISQNEEGDWVVTGSHRHPVDNDELHLRLLWNNPFVHSAVVFRRESWVAVGGYGDDSLDHFPEDFDLWSRMAALGGLANVGEELLTYRQTVGGMSDAQRERIRNGVLNIARRNLASAAGIDQDDPRIQGLARVLNSVPTATVSPAQAWQRARVLQRAVSAVAPGHAPRLLASRAKWTGKVVARSLDPRWGSLDEA